MRIFAEKFNLCPGSTVTNSTLLYFKWVLCNIQTISKDTPQKMWPNDNHLLKVVLLLENPIPNVYDLFEYILATKFVHSSVIMWTALGIVTVGNANRQIKKSKEKKIRSCRAWISNNTYIIITASRSLLWISNKVVSISCIHLHFLFFVRSLLLFGNHWIHTTQQHCMCVGWDNVVKSAERICAVDTAQ